MNALDRGGDVPADAARGKKRFELRQTMARSFTDLYDAAIAALDAK